MIQELFTAKHKGTCYKVVYHTQLGWIGVESLPPAPSPKIDVAAAANILDIHIESVRRLIRQGKLPAKKMGMKYMLHLRDVEEFDKTYTGVKGRPKQKGSNDE